MNEEALKLLKDLLALPPETLTPDQQAIIKGRVSYLTPEEMKRYSFLKGIEVKQQLPKEVHQPKVVREEVQTEAIVTGNNEVKNDPERVAKLSDRKFMENGGADPDANMQTQAAKIQTEKLEADKSNKAEGK